MNSAPKAARVPWRVLPGATGIPDRGSAPLLGWTTGIRSSLIGPGQACRLSRHPVRRLVHHSRGDGGSFHEGGSKGGSLARRQDKPPRQMPGRQADCLSSVAPPCRAKEDALFATRCIENGVDIPTVSRWLGHQDGGALCMKTYGHLRDEHSTNEARKVTF